MSSCINRTYFPGGYHLNVYGYQPHHPIPQPLEAQAGISVPKLALIGSIISLLGGLVLTASAVIAYNNSLQQNKSSMQMQQYTTNNQILA